MYYIHIIRIYYFILAKQEIQTLSDETDITWNVSSIVPIPQLWHKRQVCLKAKTLSKFYIVTSEQ